jgi:ATP-dependent Lhr-like helicase
VDPYARLAPFVREYIYEKKWKALRDIQEETIAAVLDGEKHLLIAAGTAAGKTEAAFFPILTRLKARPVHSLGALYISPLKALINDQARRLEDLLARGDLPLWSRHGDIPETAKRKLPEDPRGILQITPESLEALLIRRRSQLGALFRELAFIVIDEVHAFMGNDRGSQVICQICRIEEETGCRPRRIGLSASLGNYEEALQWLAQGSGREAALIRSAETGKEVRIALDYFRMAGTEGEAFYGLLYEQCRNRTLPGGKKAPLGKCLIFTNSRLEAEETIVRLRKIAGERGEEDIFRVHHGSISVLLREEAERKLKEETGPVVTAATASLELGIDIGDLDRIIQIGPPRSAAAFVQRLGRSGRRTGRPEIYFTVPDDTPRRDPMDAVPWSLLRGIAIIELYLREKWTEPAPPRPYPFSLLCHQTLSVLASLGEQRPADLARRVLSLPVFSRITEEDYRELLARLIDLGYLQKTGEGTIIIGLEGEPVVNHYSFYPVFPDERVYRITEGGRDLGTVNFLPPPGSVIVLAGRYWRVGGTGAEGGEIPVSPAGAGGERVWRGAGAEIHPRIVQEMKTVLAGEKDYPCLTERARKRLDEARRYSRSIGLTGVPGESAAGDPLSEASFVGGIPKEGPEGRVPFFLVPWSGSRSMGTLLVLLQNETCRDRLGLRGLYRKNDFVLRIVSSLPIPVFKEELRRLTGELIPRDRPFPGEIPEIPFVDKYDHLLPPRLLSKQYRASMTEFSP